MGKKYWLPEGRAANFRPKVRLSDCVVIVMSRKNGQNRRGQKWKEREW